MNQRASHTCLFVEVRRLQDTASAKRLPTNAELAASVEVRGKIQALRDEGERIKEELIAAATEFRRKTQLLRSQFEQVDTELHAEETACEHVVRHDEQGSPYTFRFCHGCGKSLSPL